MPFSKWEFFYSVFQQRQQQKSFEINDLKSTCYENSNSNILNWNEAEHTNSSAHTADDSFGQCQGWNWKAKSARSTKPCMVRKMWKQTTVWMCAARKPVKCLQHMLCRCFAAWQPSETSVCLSCVSRVEWTWIHGTAHTLHLHIFRIGSGARNTPSSRLRRHTARQPAESLSSLQFEKGSHCVRMYRDFHANHFTHFTTSTKDFSLF